MSLLNPPLNVLDSILYYYQYLDHPDTQSLLRKFLNSIDIEANFFNFIENPEIIHKFAVLIYFVYSNKLETIFKNSVLELFEDKPIDFLTNFITNNLELLKVLPNGKLLHIVYQELALLLSGNKGAKLLAEYLHKFIVKDEKIDKIQELYTLCEQKDRFENEYCQFCLERLLNGTDFMKEEKIIKDIKDFTGPDNMEFAFSLIKDAKDYKIPHNIMNVVVITNKLAKVLNLYAIKEDYTPKKLFGGLDGILKDFDLQFSKIYSKKVLKWQFLSSVFEVSYKNTVFRCNFLQTLILLLFNDFEEVTKELIM